MPRTVDQISATAARSLEDFDEALLESLAAIDPFDQWAFMFGETHMGEFKTTWPVQVSTPGFRLRKGNDSFRDLYEREISMVPDVYVDAIKIDERKLRGPDWRGFGREPNRIAVEMRRHPNKLVAAVLNSDANIDFYTQEEEGTTSSIPLFSANHLVNPLNPSGATFDNAHAGSMDHAMLKAAFTRFMTRKAPNGEVMGLTITDMLVPAALGQSAKDLLESDNVLTAIAQDGTAPDNATGWTQNRMKGIVNLIICPELDTHADDKIYLIDRNGPAPWAVQSVEAPEIIEYDKSDELYKNMNQVGRKYVLPGGAKALLPHAIEQITIS
jgi:hypothetical protein